MADRAHSTSRRALLAGLSVTPMLPTAALASLDPHIEAKPELLRLWREHKQTVSGWEHPTEAEECVAADDAHCALIHGCMAIAMLPPPRTLEGLAVVAVAVGLAFEGYVTEADDLPGQAFHRLVTTALTASEAAMPDDWKGMVHRASGHAVG